MKATIDIDDDIVMTALDSAFYGGSTRWIESGEIIKRGTDQNNAWAGHVLSGGILELIHADAGSDDGPPVKRSILNRTLVERGVMRMSETHPKAFAVLYSENGDANTGDLLLQCCLFGDSVF